METFQQGESVIYGANGICTVADVSLQASAPGEEARLYYILSRGASRGLTIAVPADNPALVCRMRRVLTRDEIDALLADCVGGAYLWIADRRARADAFRDTLHAGMHRDLLLMIRCIYEQKRSLQAQGKRLNVSDETTLKAAEQLVTEEFSFSLGLAPDAVGGYIRKALHIGEA